MRQRKSQRSQRVPKPKSPLKQDEPQVPTFTEIGGSPVPGLILRHVLRGNTDVIFRIAWSPDGSYLASPADDGAIRLWDAGSVQTAANSGQGIRRGLQRGVVAVPAPLLFWMVHISPRLPLMEPSACGMRVAANSCKL